MTRAEQQDQIEEDRRSNERRTLALLLLLLATAEDHAASALELGQSPANAAAVVLLGNLALHQPGLAPTLAWSMTSAWMMGQARLLADYAEATGERPAATGAIRQTLARSNSVEDIPVSMQAILGGRNLIEAEHARNLDIAQQQVRGLLPRLTDRLNAIKLPPASENVPVQAEGGQHVSPAVATAREQVADAFKKSGLSKDAPFAIESLIEANVVGQHERGQQTAEQLPQIQNALWGYRYCTIDDNRRTVLCTNLDGTILPKDDPFWKTWRPPNHFGCRSWIQRLWRKDGRPDPVPYQKNLSPEQLSNMITEKMKFLRYMNGGWN